MRTCLCLAAFAVFPGLAVAQSIDGAVSAYNALDGRWAAGGASCIGPGVWTFSQGSISTGSGQYQIRGIGGEPGQILLDLIGVQPVALAPSGRNSVAVSSAGRRTLLERCRPAGDDEAEFEDELARIERGLSAGEGLGRSAPGSIDDAFDRSQGLSTGAGVTTSPLGGDTAIGADPEADPDEVAFAAYRTAAEGAWREAGRDACGWRFSEGTISTPEKVYSVMRMGGDESRIGVNAVSEDGTPVTITLRPGGGTLGASVTGEDAVTLSRC